MQTINPISKFQTQNYSVLEILLRTLLTKKLDIQAKHTIKPVNKQKSKLKKPKQKQEISKE